MEAKKYATYAEIEKDLEILKLEKDIQYQKLLLSVQKTRESFTPQGIVKNFLGSYQTIFSESYMTIINMALPYLVKWLFKKFKKT
ncbi:DUF6327 family protein [Flavobacterium sp.]|uniref:DUF6327 family protein n=1 Tax=Flavobacterium sp. TaxID=239 RepID=UPI00286CF61D|nr:DUF6327 family protein [Flavobacterium sp.]